MKHILPLTIVLCMWLAACDFTSNPVTPYSVFETDHFAIHFLPWEFSLKEIRQIARKKEYLLERITTLLEVRFDGVITTTLDISLPNAYATNKGETFEGRSYVLDDDGHEIVHVVVFEKLGGCSDNSFLTEGLAVAVAGTLEGGDPIKSWQNIVSSIARDHGDDTSWRSDHIPITEQLSGYNKVSGGYEYLRAGAFVQFLISRFGLDRIKTLYTKTIDVRTRESFPALFQGIYGTDLDTVHKTFIEETMIPAPGHAFSDPDLILPITIIHN